MNEIKNLRLTNDLTQSEFADRISVSLRTVMRWESGDTSPSDLHVFRIAKEFDLEFEDLNAKINASAKGDR